ncbi:MAG: PDZ domain-containing protein [Phycisphaerales bacterium]|nr:PDZ domain-containing protein [Phycisphaerales bacterium]
MLGDRSRRFSRRTRNLHAAAGMAALVYMAPVAPGQTPQPAPAHRTPTPTTTPAARAELDQLLAELGSADFKTRTQAQARLRAHPDAVLARIEDMLHNRGLDAEQRTRLAALARERFGLEPRAALGINFSINPVNRNAAPAVIAGTLEGFDSARVLMANDAILAFDGSAVTNRATFRSHIISYDPGDIVRLSVDRNGELIEVHVQMGGQRDLPNDGAVQEITPSILDDAWEVRARRKNLALATDQTVLDSQLSPAAWRATWTSADGALDPREPTERFSIAAGGVPRGGTSDAMRDFVGGELRSIRGGRGMARNPQAEQIRQIQATIQEIDRLVEGIRAQAPHADPARQKDQLELLEGLLAKRAEYVQWIEEIQLRARFGGGAGGGQPRPR